MHTLNLQIFLNLSFLCCPITIKTLTIISINETLLIISAFVRTCVTGVTDSTKYLLPIEINNAPTETSILDPKISFVNVKGT